MAKGFLKPDAAKDIAKSLSTDDTRKKRGTVPVKKKLVRRKRQSGRITVADIKHVRRFRYMQAKEQLEIDRNAIMEGGKPSSNVHNLIAERARKFDKDTLAISDELVFTLFDKEEPTEEEIIKTLEKAKLVCDNSDSVSVCADLLEVADFVMYANEQYDMLGTKGIPLVKRRRLSDLIEHLAGEVGRRINRFVP